MLVEGKKLWSLGEGHTALLVSVFREPGAPSTYEEACPVPSAPFYLVLEKLLA